MSIGKTMLGRRHVLPSVISTLTELQVEGTFTTGTYLVTVHHPVASDDGDLEKALYGSFLPVPSKDAFPPFEAHESALTLPMGIWADDADVPADTKRRRCRVPSWSRKVRTSSSMKVGRGFSSRSPAREIGQYR
jgi:hypothetical protein